MKVEELERDIMGAYLNYDNDDLKTAVKQLNMSANSLLRDDKTLDPFWLDISRNVYKAVILNNFSKKIEITLKDLKNILSNQNIVYNNIIEFCNKFENNVETTFAVSLKKISENPLKSVIQILNDNINKLDSSDRSSTNSNIKKDSDNSKIQTIQCFCGNEMQFDWSKVPSTEKIVYLKCSKCGASLKRGNPFALGNTNSNSAGTAPLTNKQLIEELSNYIKKSGEINIFEDWYSCKKANPQFQEFFDITEKEAMQELIKVQDKATILKHSLRSYISIPDPNRELGLNNLMVTYFGLQSIYDRKLENSNGLFECLSIDNVGLFRAILMINITAIMYHISDNSLPIGLKLIFERKEFVDILGPIVKSFLPKIIPSINEIKFFYKK